MPRICANVWVTSFVTGVPSGYEYVCWDASDDIDAPPGGGGGNSGGESGVTVGGGGSGVNFDPDPSGSGTVVAPGPEPDYDDTLDLNPGWNSGAHSIENVPADWQGMISFDIPDVQGVRPGGVAVGLAPVSDLPTSGRNGYGHLQYGLVFTSDTVKIIHGGAEVGTISYATIRAAREVGETTDRVSILMYGGFVKWIVNGITVFAGSFSMPENYALDAVLYLAYDAVDTPKFEAGEWGDVEDGSLNGALPAFAMTGDASAETSLVLELPAFAAQFSDNVVWNLFGNMAGFTLEAGEGEGITGTIGPIGFVAADTATYGGITGSIGPFSAWIGMGTPSTEVPYSVLAPALPRFAMTATGPISASINAAIQSFVMRASAEASYSELSAELRGFRFAAYGGEMTPLVQIIETVAYYAPVFQSTYMGIAFTEHVDGTATAAVYATVTAEASEEITAQDTATAILTMLDSIAEQIGAGERFTASVFRTGGDPVDDSQAWAVNTESNASTRYDNYGFNSFATVRGKQFGARQDGLYLLAGTDDDGIPIASGVALGMHDFGTQALKRLDSVYAGVSSTGALFIKVGDGVNSYSYRARRNDDRMKVQRFDIGRGIRTNYFTFDLTSDADAFELDSVTFHVLPTNRRI